MYHNSSTKKTPKKKGKKKNKSIMGKTNPEC